MIMNNSWNLLLFFFKKRKRKRASLMSCKVQSAVDYISKNVISSLGQYETGTLFYARKVVIHWWPYRETIYSAKLFGAVFSYKEDN